MQFLNESEYKLKMELNKENCKNVDDLKNYNEIFCFIVSLNLLKILFYRK